MTSKFWMEGCGTIVCTETDMGDGPQSYEVARFCDLVAPDGTVTATASDLALRFVRIARSINKQERA